MNKQIIRNICFNVINFVINMVIGILLTPYLIKHMGVVAYGMVPLAMFITSYIGILTQSLTASVNRCLINALHSNNKFEANLIFNTALILMISLIVVIGAILIWPIAHIGYFISVPEILLNEATTLFLSILVAFFISLISSVFSVPLFAKNRMDLMQSANIIKNLTKLISILSFFYFGIYRLSVVGYSIVLSEIISLMIYVYMSRREIPDIRVRLNLFDISIVRKISGLGGWLIVDQIGVMFLSKLDLLLVNKIFGSSYSGKYAVITQFSDLFRTMASLIGSVLGPVMMILYSQGEQSKMADLTKSFMKFMSLTMAIPIIVLCVFSKEIVEMWVGHSFNDITYLVWFIVFPLIINLGTMPLFSINIAMNKVKIPSLSNIIFGVIGLLITLYLVYYLHLGMEGIALGFILATTLKNSLFTPLYAAYILHLPKLTFITVHIRTLLFTLMFSIFSYYAKEHIEAKGLCLLLFLLFLCCLGFIFTLAFYTPTEIKNIVKIARKIGRKN
ncbi:oligosaccharide flippase family protein [Escherichia albertii]|nr:oligosaccharide flippase family protein [Escherichia albertii]